MGGVQREEMNRYKRKGGSNTEVEEEEKWQIDKIQSDRTGTGNVRQQEKGRDMEDYNVV